jgi:transcriptional antiterminator RfaH
MLNRPNREFAGHRQTSTPPKVLPELHMYAADPCWYLLRTKPNRERFVREQLARVLSEIFLPMLKLPLTRVHRGTPSLVPLFPQYVFARLNLATQFFEVRYMPGVTGFVSTGPEPIAVSEAIVDSVRSRCTDCILHLNPIPFRCGEHVRVVEGPFRDFEAIFENYLSGTKRVAILMQSIGGCGVRVVADASTVARLHPKSLSILAASNR